MLPLSQRLFAMVPDGFFRPLAGRSAAVYIDCADRLIEAAGETGRLPLAEAVAVVREVLITHPRESLESDEGADLADVRARANRFYNKLLEVRWIEAHSTSLHERWAVISPGLRPVLRMLKALAVDELAELKGFADTLREVCGTLEQEDYLGQDELPDDLRSRVRDLGDRLSHAVEQLHTVEKLIVSYEARQMTSATGAETLRLFFHDFYEGEHMVCQDALRRGGLLNRMQKARSTVRFALEHPKVVQRLAEGIALGRKQPIAPNEAFDRALTSLQGLDRQLAGIRVRADAIDMRIAAFNRLSVQRYRYQTEMRGRRPEMIKRYCDLVNQRHAGERFSQLDSALVGTDFDLLVPHVGLVHGTASLSRPRRMRVPPALTLAEGRIAQNDDPEETARLRDRQRLALTPARAAKLIARRLAEKGGMVSTNQFESTSEEDLLDLMAAAAYGNAPDGTGRIIRWEIKSPRQGGMIDPDTIPLDHHHGWDVERLTLVRSA